MANQIIGSLVANNLLPSQLRPAGTLTFGPVDLPAGFGMICIMFDLREVTSLTAELSCALELALDGTIWEAIGGGGINIPKSGYRLVNGVLTRSELDTMGSGPVRVFGEMVFLPHTELTTRKVRGSLSQTESLITGVSLVVW